MQSTLRTFNKCWLEWRHSLSLHSPSDTCLASYFMQTYALLTLLEFFWHLPSAQNLWRSQKAPHTADYRVILSTGVTFLCSVSWRMAVFFPMPEASALSWTPPFSSLSTLSLNSDLSQTSPLIHISTTKSRASPHSTLL